MLTLVMSQESERVHHVATIQSSIGDASSIDRLLIYLEHQQELPQSDTAVLGPFGIFRLQNDGASENPENSVVREEQGESSTPSLSIFLDTFAMSDPVDEANTAADLQLVPAFSGHSPPDVNADTTSQQGPFDTPLESNKFFSDAAFEAQSLSVSLPSAMPITCDVQTRDLDFVTIRILLDRYEHGLTPCFSPARMLSKSPWQKLHIPKVHETLGCLMVRGNAENSKISLLFAVLGASAYHLAILGPSNQDSRSWKVVADSYRSRAKLRLKMSLQQLSLSQRAETYIDILMALLSMVTVCVSAPESLPRFYATCF